MGYSKTLEQTVERTKKEVKKLLTKARDGKLDMNRLECGLKEVQSNLKVLDYHLHKHDAK